MKPAPFDYLCPVSVDEVVSQLASYGGEAKILAGGQSLVPMMNLRLLSPTALIDINRVEGLNFIDETDRGLRIGARVRHHEIEMSPVVRQRLPILASAAREIGHLAIRNRGTFTGSLAHGDPAAEWPLLCSLLDAEVHITGPTGRRTLPVSDFSVSYMTTALQHNELVTEVEIPLPAAETGWGFEKFARRHGDFAIVSAAATVSLGADTAREVRIALGGVGMAALRASDAERLLQGERLDEEILERVGGAAQSAADPIGDLHATADFRRHLVGVLTRRVVRAAWQRALS